jgi:diguanylate cyclase (GGDEF)-like protein
VLLLALNFFCSGAISLITLSAGANFLTDSYSAYQSIFDLLLEMLVAFGLVAMAAVDMRTTLERARISMQGERDRMTMLAQQDALTGCFNRFALEELKSRLENRHGSVAMIDVDRLKPINDMHGHAIGDLAICHVANALKSELRGNDYVFRTGGDEFVLVAFDLPPGLAMKRLQQAAKTLLTVELVPEHVGGLSISFGVAEFHGSDNFDAALETADTAMYSQKQAERAS